MTGEKCDAMYCHDLAEIGVRLKADDTDSVIGLCLEHWFKHCDDETVDLRGGRKLMPVPMMLSPAGQKDYLAAQRVPIGGPTP